MTPAAVPVQPQQWIEVGPHRYRIDDDMLYATPFGELSVEHVGRVCTLLESILRRKGYVLYLIDARNSVPIGYESRRAYVRWFQEVRPRIITCAFGSAQEPRATAVFITNAARMLVGVETVMHSAETEAEARAFLATERERLLREIAARRSHG